MSTLYSTQAAIQAAPTPETLLESGLFGAKVRFAHAKFTASAAHAAGTVVNLIKLPKGARLLPHSFIHFEAGQGATTTVKVGDDDATADDDRYLAAVVVGASSVSISLAAAALSPHKLEQESWIQLTTGVAALTDAKSFAAYIFYTVE